MDSERLSRANHRTGHRSTGANRVLAFIVLVTVQSGCGPQDKPTLAPDAGQTAVAVEPMVPITEIEISRFDESPVLGRWEVVDYHITPVAAADDETVLDWLGQLVVYTAGLVGFQDELCDSPTYREHVELFEEYFEDFEVSPNLFEIQDPNVDIISIDCYGESWSGPGSEMQN